MVTSARGRMIHGQWTLMYCSGKKAWRSSFGALGACASAYDRLVATDAMVSVRFEEESKARLRIRLVVPAMRLIMRRDLT